MKISIDLLYVLVGTDMDGKPTTYSKLFTDKAEAEKLAAENNMIVNTVFLNSEI